MERNEGQESDGVWPAEQVKLGLWILLKSAGITGVILCVRTTLRQNALKDNYIPKCIWTHQRVAVGSEIRRL